MPDQFDQFIQQYNPHVDLSDLQGSNQRLAAAKATQKFPGGKGILPEEPLVTTTPSYPKAEGDQFDQFVSGQQKAQQPPQQHHDDSAEVAARNQQADQNYAGAHPFRNAANAFEAATTNALVGGTIWAGRSKATSNADYDKQLNVARRAASDYGAVQDTPSGKVGNFAGKLVPTVMSGPGAPLMAGFMAGNDAQMDVSARRAAGENISPLAATANIGGNAALQAGMTYFMPGGQATHAAEASMFPNGMSLAEKALFRTGSGVLGSQVENAGNQLGTNVINNATLPGQQVPVTQGVAQAAELNPMNAFGGLVGGIHGAAEGANPAPHAAVEPNVEQPQTPAPVQQPAAPAPSAQVPQLRKQIADLNQRLNDFNDPTHPNTILRQIADQAKGEKAVDEHSTALDEGNHTFRSPDEMKVAEMEPGGFKHDLAMKQLNDRMSDGLQDQNRRVEGNSKDMAPEDERRFDELTKGATFESPEQVNPRGIEALNGWKPGTPAPHVPSVQSGTLPDFHDAYDPRAAYEQMNQQDRINSRVGETPQPAQPAPTNALAEAAARHAETLKAVEPTQNTPVEETKPPVAASPAAVPENAPAGESFFDQIKRVGAAKMAELAKDEEGGEPLEAAGLAMVRRDLVPAAKNILAGGKSLATALDRHLDLGFSNTKEGNQSRLDLRKTMGDAILAGHAFEDAVVKTGARDKAYKFSTDEASALKDWDHIENGGKAQTPEEQNALDLIEAKRKQNFQRSEKLGMNMKDEQGEALSRLFMEDKNAIKPGKGTSKSIAGAEAFRKSQKFENASDAYNAAKAGGLKPAYDNIYDMQMAQQYEVERSLAARENLRAADKGGTIRWFPENTKPDEGFETPIKDKVATETRKMALPTWMVGKFANLKGFEADQFLKDHASDMKDVTPGEKPPTGYSFTTKEVKGTYHAPEDTARTFNDMLSQGKGDPISSLPAKIAKATIMQRYGLSVVHALNGAKAYLNQQIGDSVLGAFKLRGRDSTDAIRGMKNIATLGYSGWKRGADIQTEIEHPGTFPELSETAKRVAQSNPETKFKSVLDRSKWNDAADEFKAQNWQGGTARVLKNVIDAAPNFIYHGVLDKLDMSVRGDVADAHIRAGKTQAEGAADLAQAGDTISRALGRHVNSPAFKNSIITQVGKLAAPAYQYKAGLLRNATVEPFIRMNPHAQAQLVGSIVSTAIAGAAAQMALSYANTGKVIAPTQSRDYWNPRTGNKDANGHEERMTFPGSEAFLMRSLGGAGEHGMKDEALSSLNPAITGTADVVKNRDFFGNQIMTDDNSKMGNVMAAGKHILSGALPMSAVSLFGHNDQTEGEPPSWGHRLLQSATGMQTSHPVTSNAEQIIYDAMNHDQAGRTPAEAVSRVKQGEWANRLRANPDDDSVYKEMSEDPTMNPNKQKSVIRRSQEKQGIAGLVNDTQIKTPTLQKAWDAATDSEKGEMKDSMIDRMEKEFKQYPRMSKVEQATFEKLYHSVTGDSL